VGRKVVIMKKTEEQKLNIEELEMVSGGRNNQLGDIEFIKALLNRGFKNDIYDGSRTMHRVFAAAGITVKGDNLIDESEYIYKGKKIKRCDALILVARYVGKPNFNLNPYL
jgi:hypothetical protein